MSDFGKAVYERVKTTVVGQTLTPNQLQLVALGTLYEVRDWTHTQVRAAVLELETELKKNGVIV